MEFEFAAKFNRILISAVPLLLGIICHEVAHGYVAYRCGDPTAKLMGRLTLNPKVHIDPTGALMFVLTAMFFPFALGWAKPVPVDTRNLRNPRRDMALVAAAGPATNFILAILFMACFLFTALVLRSYADSIVYIFIYDMLQVGVFINLVLAFFNLLPIPPMDGSRLLSMAMPYEAARAYNRLERYGMFIILFFLATGMFGKIIVPLVYACYNGMLWIFLEIISAFQF
jgi:Zn-dependent protease